MGHHEVTNPRRICRLLRRRTLVTIAGAATLTLLLFTSSACPDGTGMHSAMHGVGPRARQTPVRSQAESATVEIGNFDFAPRDLTVKAETQVTWTNRDGVPHDATDDAEAWTTGLLKQGGSATLTFEVPGRYTYRCTIHPQMQGVLTVEAQA